MFLDKVSLPQQAYEAKQVQENESKIAKEAHLSMYQLMEKAGASLFSWLSAHYEHTQPLLIVCGKGNNGGDGYILARLALEAKFSVHIMVVASESDIKGDARKALKKLQGNHCSSTNDKNSSLTFLDSDKNTVNFFQKLKCFLSSEKSPLVVDALFGIGFKGKLDRELHGIVEAINTANLPILSVDIPSGMIADTGVASPIAIKAMVTITFIAMKKGLLTGKAANYVGQLFLSDLGLGQYFQSSVLSDTLVQNAHNLPTLKARDPASHKGHIGHAVCVGGNAGFPGAIRLSGESALRSGASLVSIVCHKKSASLIFRDRPEFMLLPNEAHDAEAINAFEKAKVIILGPGLGKDTWAHDWFTNVMRYQSRQVIDADALRLLSQTEYKNNHWVLTPHPGEAASLLNCDIESIETNRFSAVKSIAQKYGGVCVLKGAGTLISDGKYIWVNTTGNAGMASGGMGDVLSGLIGALMMQMSDNLQATRLAVYIHGHAADILAKKEGMNGMLASDLLPVIRQLLNEHVESNIK